MITCKLSVDLSPPIRHGEGLVEAVVRFDQNESHLIISTQDVGVEFASDVVLSIQKLSTDYLSFVIVSTCWDAACK